MFVDSPFTISNNSRQHPHHSSPPPCTHSRFWLKLLQLACEGRPPGAPMDPVTPTKKRDVGVVVIPEGLGAPILPLTPIVGPIVVNDDLWEDELPTHRTSTVEKHNIVCARPIVCARVWDIFTQPLLEEIAADFPSEPVVKRPRKKPVKPVESGSLPQPAQATGWLAAPPRRR